MVLMRLAQVMRCMKRTGCSEERFLFLLCLLHGVQVFECIPRLETALLSQELG